MPRHVPDRPRRLRTGTGLVVLVIAMVALGTVVTGGVAAAQAAGLVGPQADDEPPAGPGTAAAPRRANDTLRLPAAGGAEDDAASTTDPSDAAADAPASAAADTDARSTTPPTTAPAGSPDAATGSAGPADGDAAPAAEDAARLEDAAARRADAYNAQPLGGADRAGPFAGLAIGDGSRDDAVEDASTDALRSSTWLQGSGGELVRVGGALAVVLMLAVLLAKAMRRVNRLATGRRPSGVIEVHARYPIARGQTLVLMQLGRRIVLAHQSGTAMTTLTEVVDPDEVAALLARIEAGSPDTEAGVFHRLLRDVETGRAPLETPADRPAADRGAARPSRRRAILGRGGAATATTAPTERPAPVAGPGGVELIDLTAAKRRTGLGGRR